MNNEEFRIATEEEISEGKAVRAYQLNNGDVFSTCNLLLEYENRVLYEVIRISDAIFESRYERTGRSFTLEQITEMAKAM